MWFAELLFAFIIALIFSFLLLVVFGRGRRSDEEALWPGFIFLFFILFLATWAGGAWVTPIGPTVWGAVWLPFLFVGIAGALARVIRRVLRPTSRVLRIACTAVLLGYGIWRAIELNTSRRLPSSSTL